jgi:hypothetical protein
MYSALIDRSILYNIRPVVGEGCVVLVAAYILGIEMRRKLNNGEIKL